MLPSPPVLKGVSTEDPRLPKPPADKAKVARPKSAQRAPVLTLSGLPAGAGILLVRTVDGTGVYYQAATVS